MDAPDDNGENSTKRLQLHRPYRSSTDCSAIIELKIVIITKRLCDSEVLANSPNFDINHGSDLISMPASPACGIDPLEMSNCNGQACDKSVPLLDKPLGGPGKSVAIVKEFLALSEESLAIIFDNVVAPFASQSIVKDLFKVSCIGDPEVHPIAVVVDLTPEEYKDNDYHKTLEFYNSSGMGPAVASDMGGPPYENRAASDPDPEDLSRASNNPPNIANKKREISHVIVPLLLSPFSKSNHYKHISVVQHIPSND
ncbi:hypothetical protein G7046_g4015 [Stylonectria norvegica]|nr:hypothetical protein G7046_g4015 [Stylonectria norvegica]